MKKLFFAVAGVWSVTVLVSAQAPPAGKTVWNGVYTDAQAERARATFDSICTRCHTLEPGGNTRGGALSGDKFWTAFTQKSVGDLLDFVSKNMPNGNGGSLPASTYNDLVALILKSNGFPAGTVEVAPESTAKAPRKVARSATRAPRIVRIVVQPDGQQVDPDVGGRCAAWQRQNPNRRIWIDVNREAIPECTGPNGKPTIAQFCAFAVLEDGRRVKTENSTNDLYCERLFQLWVRERVT